MSILNKETVWITGAGVNVPHGTSVAEVAEGVLGGRSTVSSIISTPRAIPARLARGCEPFPGRLAGRAISTR